MDEEDHFLYWVSSPWDVQQAQEYQIWENEHHSESSFSLEMGSPPLYL